MKGFFAALALLFVIAGLSFGWILGLMGDFNKMEIDIEARYQVNQTSYDKMWKTFKESAQVTEAYAGDMEKTFRSVMEGRYGEKGSQALFQMITEQNPQFDASLYKQLQQTIEVNRSDFHKDQTTLISMVQTYQKMMAPVLTGIIAKALGYPRVNLDKYKPVTSDRTSNAFETKKDEEIQLRNKSK